MRGRAISYTAEELAWIEANKEMSRHDLHLEFCERFCRNDVTVEQLKALCSRRKWATGRSGRFRPGQMPPNKGQKMPFNANSARTQFKKGQVPANVKGIGHERVSKDGYVEISVDQVNPYTGHSRRYVLKHRWLWVQKFGPVPKGHCLKALDGNRQNTDPDNWIAVPRSLLPRLNGRFGRDYDSAPAELKPTIMAIANLEHHARTKGGTRRRNRPAQKETA